MSDWGRATFGDPCRECGFEWSISREAAVSLVSEVPNVLRRIIDPADPWRRHRDLSWSVTAYVCHIVDNLRIWAERLAGAVHGGSNVVEPYDQDLIAAARNYERLPIEGALWSLESAARDWREAVDLAMEQRIVLVHPERGDQTVLDVCRTNAHDVAHHRWDIERSLR